MSQHPSRAVRRVVHIKPLDEVVSTIIIIPDSVKNPPSRGLVLATGSDVVGFKSGDEVLLRKLEGEYVTVPGHPRFIAIDFDHILAVVEPNDIAISTVSGKTPEYTGKADETGKYAEDES
jgi:co-chaperonin GroES (HSP10)